MVGWTRARRVWNASWFLRALEVPVPEPQGYFVYTYAKYRSRNYFCSESLCPRKSLLTIVSDSPDIVHSTPMKSLLREISVGLARFHGSGAFHGDLKWSNIIVSETLDRFWFADLDACVIGERPPGSKDVAKDLVRFLLDAAVFEVAESFFTYFVDNYAASNGQSSIAVWELVMPRLRRAARRKGIDIESLEKAAKHRAQP